MNNTEARAIYSQELDRLADQVRERLGTNEPNAVGEKAAVPLPLLVAEAVKDSIG